MDTRDTVTVQLQRSDAEIVSALARSRNASITDVLHDAIEVLARRTFLEGVNNDWEHMSPSLRAQLDAEYSLWDHLA
jgi:hypothetical protein